MTLARLRRLPFFSTIEWWYHCLMMPVLFPVGNYYFIGPRYFQEPTVFIVGTVLVAGLYWLSIVTLTLAVRWVIRQFPDEEQALPRTLVMLGLVGGLTTGLAAFDVWAYSLVPGLDVTFSWAAVRPIWLLGFIFDVFLCIALSMFYAYSQWKQNQTENEQLKRAALQHQFDALKGQLNPHFLFNSLNSLSSLIGDEPEQAEQFVDEMSKVYRYLLQTNEGELTTLASELRFIDSYFHLLKTRYQAGIRLEIDVSDTYRAYRLPPLTLQMLVENVVKHNVIQANKPLTIEIMVTPDGQLLVRNNLQRKVIRMASNQVGLTNIETKYRLLGQTKPIVSDDDGYFTIVLSLLDPVSV